MVAELVFVILSYLLGRRGKDEDKRIVTERLLSEIEGNQDQLRPFSDCVTKVFDNDIETSEEDRFPNELNFNRNIYSEFSGRFGLLDGESRKKIDVYYPKLEVIEKGYPKLNIHESSSLDGQKINQGHPFSHLVCLMFDEKFGKHTNLNEIEAFLRNAKEVYDLGEELIISLKG
uniref:Uncharacterized protein n=1 Tax=uncultured Methanosarcinales archaeon TaxID=183757 RepID=A0A7H1KNQ0_9EURY|nr:hypothetical protein HCAOCCDF_00012 [uncultured Methanosarcinales archaeon]